MPPSRGFERVVYAGLLEVEKEEKRLRDGIPYHQEVVEWFESYCSEAKIKAAYQAGEQPRNRCLVPNRDWNW